MRRCVRPAPVLLLALLVTTSCGGRERPWTEAPRVAIDLVAKLSATSVPLLAPFEVQLDLYRRKDLEVDFEPAVPAGCSGTVELFGEQEFGDGRTRQAVLRLVPIAGPGPLKLPPFVAKAKDGTVSASTAELQLEVTSLLAQAGGELEAPAQPMLPRRPLWPWIAGAWVVLVLAALAFRVLRRGRRGPSVALATAVPPHIKAMRDLQRLRGQSRRSAVEIDAFYVAVSAVLRVYLEERFGLRAPERTTEEFLSEIEAGGPLSAAQCLEVRRFLQQCDLVKFAAQTPGDEVHLQTLAIAELLVESTRQDRVPLEATA